MAGSMLDQGRRRGGPILRLNVFLFGLWALSPPGLLLAQENVDYNLYYQFPLGVGVEFQSHSPLYDTDQEVSGIEVAAYARVPLPMAPRLQPYVRAGLSRYTVTDQNDLDAERSTDRWNHLHYHGILGFGFTERFAQQFEAGGDVGVGFGQTYFTNLSDDGPLGDLTFVTELAGRMTFSPRYSLGIEFRPALRYSRSLGEMNRYDGFSLNLGFSINYRFGQDPDADGGIIRSIRFDRAEVSDIFPAMQSYYIRNPIGFVEFANRETIALQNVVVSFFQEGFMDNPTQAAQFDQLLPGEMVLVELPAAFNGNVFLTEGITPLSGEVIVDYTYRTRGVQQRLSVDYDMHDLRALTWDDTRKAAAMITPADSTMQNFTSYSRQAARNETLNGIPAPLQTAMILYYSLKETGMIYQRDPVIPFDEAQANPAVVDRITLPRQTLQQATGECDDMTVLYCSLLESAAIETGFIATPGHLYAMINTEVPADQYRLVHPDPRMTLEIDGQLWVPIEITLVGQANFMAAWREGVNEWHRNEHRADERELHRTRPSQQVFRPVALRQADVPVTYGDRERIAGQFRQGLAELVDVILTQYESVARASNTARDYNQMGIAAADFRRFGVAERAFNTALSMDRNFLAAQINLGNLYLVQEQYQSALRSFHRAEQSIIRDRRERSRTYPQILLAISQSYYQLGNFDRAQDYFLRLDERDPGTAAENRHLGERGARTSMRIE